MRRQVQQGFCLRRYLPTASAAAFILLAAVLLSPVRLGLPDVAAHAEEAAPAGQEGDLGYRMVGTWRSVGEQGFPDVTFHDGGGISFAEQSSQSTNSSGCSTEDVKSWRVSDPEHVEFVGDTSTRPVKVQPVDDRCLQLVDESGGNTIVLVRIEVFDQPPVLLIHGINGEADDWMAWISPEGRAVVAEEGSFRLEFARSDVFGPDVPVFLLDYRSSCHAAIIENAAGVPWSIDTLSVVCQPSGGTVRTYIAAHSMGGLLSRAYLQSIPLQMDPNSTVPTYGEGGRQDVMGLTTIGTPHGGSYLMQLKDEGGTLPLPGPLQSLVLDFKTGQAGTDMHPRSPFINALNSSDLPTTVRYACIVGYGADNPPAGLRTRGYILGDGAVQADAQVPYKSSSAAGYSQERSQAFQSSEQFVWMYYWELLHNDDLVDAVGGNYYTSETSDTRVMSFVAKHYADTVAMEAAQ